jgi:hypothetical protein
MDGYLDRRWSPWFGDLRLSHHSDGTTILCGPVVDQAALHGLLAKVRDLNLTLISVIRVDPVRCDELRDKETQKGIKDE